MPYQDELRGRLSPASAIAVTADGQWASWRDPGMLCWRSLAGVLGMSGWPPARPGGKAHEGTASPDVWNVRRASSRMRCMDARLVRHRAGAAERGSGRSRARVTQWNHSSEFRSAGRGRDDIVPRHQQEACNGSAKGCSPETPRAEEHRPEQSRLGEGA